MATAQLNLRIPIDLKTKAQNKAESFWTNLNFLVKLFLTKLSPRRWHNRNQTRYQNGKNFGSMNYWLPKVI